MHQKRFTTCLIYEFLHSSLGSHELCFNVAGNTYAALKELLCDGTFSQILEPGHAGYDEQRQVLGLPPNSRWKTSFYKLERYILSWNSNSITCDLRVAREQYVNRNWLHYDHRFARERILCSFMQMSKVSVIFRMVKKRRYGTSICLLLDHEIRNFASRTST